MKTIVAQNEKVFRKKKTNTISISQILFSGILIKNQKKNQIWYIPNAFELFPANTVEGFVFNPKIKFTQNYKDGRFFTLVPNFRYGFGNKRVQTQINTKYFYLNSNNNFVEINGGRAIEQLYKKSTLNALNNTISTFIFSKNFMKVYERSYLELNHVFSPVKDFLLTTTVSWNNRNPLNNLDRYKNENGYTPNNPKNIELANTTFTKNTAIIFEAKLRWQIDFKTEKKRGQLISNGKHPALILSYTNSTDKILNGDVSYEKLSFSLQDDYEIENHSGRLFMEVGDFLKKKNLTFLDFNHFKGKETIYGTYDVNQFQLLDYYNNSTEKFYIQGHYEHYFKAFYDKFKFQPLIGINYLYTEAGGNYIELGTGIDKLLNKIHIDFYTSWRKGSYEKFGVRIGTYFD